VPPRPVGQRLERFADTPERYPGIARQLRKARPNELIVDNLDAWPQDNERAEDNCAAGYETSRR